MRPTKETLTTDDQERGLRQPLRGAAAFVVTAGLSLAFCALFTPATLGSWVALVFICTVPAMVVLAVDLHLESPGFLARAPQPAKGVIFVALAVVHVVFGRILLSEARTQTSA